MCSIFAKEIKIYLRKPLSFIFIAAFFMATAFIFINNVVIGSFSMEGIVGNTNIQDLFKQLPNFIWVLIPILSVGLIPDEKTNSTDRLLAASPISSCEIVIGKYLAALLVYVVGLISTLLFTIIMISHAKTEFMYVFNSYFAMLMYGSGILAMGLFFGAALKNSLAGAAATFGTMFFMNQITMLKMIENFSEETGEAASFLPAWLIKVVDFFAINDKYAAFFGSSVSPMGFVYFLSLTVVFLLLACITVEKRSCN